MNEDVLAIGGFFSTVVLVCFTIVGFLAFRQRERHQTLRAAVAQGQSIASILPAEKAPVGGDLRRGILLISAGLGGLPAIWALAPSREMLSVAAFPVALGFGHLLAHQLTKSPKALSQASHSAR